MHKILTLLLALLMVTLNAFAGVNVNTANEKELQMLTGIGPAKAKAIIDFRTKNGEFKTVDDLLKVPGIGPVVLGKMKADVALSGPTTGKGTSASAAPAAKAAPPAAAPTASPPAAATGTPSAPAPTTAAPAKPATAAPPAATAAAAAPAAKTAAPTGKPEAAKLETAQSKESDKKADKKDHKKDDKKDDKKEKKDAEEAAKKGEAGGGGKK